jgi:hypothetical protein
MRYPGRRRDERRDGGAVRASHASINWWPHRRAGPMHVAVVMILVVAAITSTIAIAGATQPVVTRPARP